MLFALCLLTWSLFPMLPVNSPMRYTNCLLFKNYSHLLPLHSWNPQGGTEQNVLVSKMAGRKKREKEGRWEGGRGGNRREGRGGKEKEEKTEKIWGRKDQVWVQACVSQYNPQIRTTPDKPARNGVPWALSHQLYEHQNWVLGPQISILLSVWVWVSPSVQKGVPSLRSLPAPTLRTQTRFLWFWRMGDFTSSVMHLEKQKPK